MLKSPNETIAGKHQTTNIAVSLSLIVQGSFVFVQSIVNKVKPNFASISTLTRHMQPASLLAKIPHSFFLNEKYSHPNSRTKIPLVLESAIS